MGQIVINPNQESYDFLAAEQERIKKETGKRVPLAELAIQYMEKGIRTPVQNSIQTPVQHSVHLLGSIDELKKVETELKLKEKELMTREFEVYKREVHIELLEKKANNLFYMNQDEFERLKEQVEYLNNLVDSQKAENGAIHKTYLQQIHDNQEDYFSKIRETEESYSKKIQALLDKKISGSQQNIEELKMMLEHHIKTSNGNSGMDTTQFLGIITAIIGMGFKDEIGDFFKDIMGKIGNTNSIQAPKPQVPIQTQTPIQPQKQQVVSKS